MWTTFWDTQDSPPIRIIGAAGVAPWPDLRGPILASLAPAWGLRFPDRGGEPGHQHFEDMGGDGVETVGGIHA